MGRFNDSVKVGKFMYLIIQYIENLYYLIISNARLRLIEICYFIIKEVN